MKQIRAFAVALLSAACAFNAFREKRAKMWRWFKRADRLPFFFGGIWRPWTGDRCIESVQRASGRKCTDDGPEDGFADFCALPCVPFARREKITAIRAKRFAELIPSCWHPASRPEISDVKSNCT